MHVAKDGRAVSEKCDKRKRKMLIGKATFYEDRERERASTRKHMFKWANSFVNNINNSPDDFHH